MCTSTAFAGWQVLTRYCYYLLYHSWQQIGDWRDADARHSALVDLVSWA